MEIQDIKQSLLLTDLLSRYKLTPNETNRLNCPFHKDTEKNFQIFPQSNTWKCHSTSCKSGDGDVLDFIRRMEKCDQPKAIMKAKFFLANEALGKKVESSKLTVNSKKPETENSQLTTENFPLETLNSKPTTFLNTENPEYLIFTMGELSLSVLGGIRLEGLDHLKVTLKISRIGKRELPSLRQPVDLYNHDFVERLTRRIAEKFELGTIEVSKVLSTLTDELEDYRRKTIESRRQPTDNRPQLTAKEIKEAEDYLKQTDLMKRTLADIGKSGVVGEELNRLLVYLCYTSRKRERPLHLITTGTSGSGKTYLQDKISELIPDEDKITVTSLSENALYYFGQTELRNKLILIEDLDGAEDVLYPLRELQTKQKISKTVALKDSKGNLTTQTFTVEGPVATSGCTTKEKLYEDNANRVFLIEPDISKEQDERIMSYQKSLSSGTVNRSEEQQIKTIFKNVQRVLQPVTVVNPFAEKLQLPETVFKQRRSNELYLNLIETITFYHQFQRKQSADKTTGEVLVYTSPEDIFWANKLITHVLIRKSDELSGGVRRFFEELKNMLSKQNQSSFYSRQLREKMNLSYASIKKNLSVLERNGFVQIVSGSYYKGFEYQLCFDEYDQIKKTIETTLNETFSKLSGSGGSKPSSHKTSHIFPIKTGT